MDGFKAWNKSSSILNRFLFPPPKASYSWSNFHGELVAVCTESGDSVFPCLLMPGVRKAQDSDEDEAATAVFIYCHANGEDVGLCYEAGHWLCENLGVHVVIPEYPSYGPSPGRPNELTVYENVRATYNMVTQGIGFSPRKVIMFGRSIGTGPAIKLASELDVGGLVLVSPFVSVGNIVQHHVGFLASWLTDGLAEIFPSIDLIPDAECPTLFVHGSLDTVIPVTHSEQLHGASGGICKQLVILEGIGHHGIDLHIAVVNEAPRMFVLDGDPKELNIDQQLNDPSKTSARIRAPVPAWDCYSGKWCRTSLPMGETPKISWWAGEVEKSGWESLDASTSDGTVGGDWFAERTVAAGIGAGGEGMVQQEREQFLHALHQSDEAPASASGGGAPGKTDGSPRQPHPFQMTYTPRPPSPQSGATAASGGRVVGQVEEAQSGHRGLGGAMAPPVGPDNPQRRYLY